MNHVTLDQGASRDPPMSPRGLIRLGKGRNEEGGTESIELMMDLSLATLLPRLSLSTDATHFFSPINFDVH